MQGNARLAQIARELLLVAVRLCVCARRLTRDFLERFAGGNLVVSFIYENSTIFWENIDLIVSNCRFWIAKVTIFHDIFCWFVIAQNGNESTDQDIATASIAAWAHRRCKRACVQKLIIALTRASEIVFF
jgi:hypothetical protein